MKIFVNDENMTTKSRFLSDLLKELKLNELSGTAVAINNSVINRNLFDKQVLKEHDRIVILKASQGG